MSALHDPASSIGGSAPGEPPSLGAVLALRDAQGVLSLYLNEGDSSGSRDEADLSPLVQELCAGWPSSDLRAVRRATAELERRLAGSPNGPGRALFVGLASGRAIDVRLPVPVTAHAAVDRRAHVVGLVDAGRRARPAGLVVLSAARLELYELRGPTLRELDAVDLATAERAWRLRRGRPGAPSAPARQPGPARDRHVGRRRERLASAAAGFAERAGAAAEARRWDLTLAAGGHRLRADFARRFPTWRRELVDLTAAPARLDQEALARRAFDEVSRRREERIAARVAELTDDPATIWGADPVLTALRRGKVAELMVAADVDGELSERLVRGALSTGAGPTLVDRGVLGPLGVAARARW